MQKGNISLLSSNNFPCTEVYKKPDDASQLEPKHVAVGKQIHLPLCLIYLWFVNSSGHVLASNSDITLLHLSTTAAIQLLHVEHLALIHTIE
jgi:hypothetical protein